MLGFIAQRAGVGPAHRTPQQTRGLPGAHVKSDLHSLESLQISLQSLRGVEVAVGTGVFVALGGGVEVRGRGVDVGEGLHNQVLLLHTVLQQDPLEPGPQY